jgi:hypothetical protein
MLRPHFYAASGALRVTLVQAMVNDVILSMNVEENFLSLRLRFVSTTMGEKMTDFDSFRQQWGVSSATLIL